MSIDITVIVLVLHVLHWTETLGCLTLHYCVEIILIYDVLKFAFMKKKEEKKEWQKYKGLISSLFSSGHLSWALKLELWQLVTVLRSTSISSLSLQEITVLIYNFIMTQVGEVVLYFTIILPILITRWYCGDLNNSYIQRIIKIWVYEWLSMK